MLWFMVTCRRTGVKEGRKWLQSRAGTADGGIKEGFLNENNDGDDRMTERGLGGWCGRQGRRETVKRWGRKAQHTRESEKWWKDHCLGMDGDDTIEELTQKLRATERRFSKCPAPWDDGNGLCNSPVWPMLTARFPSLSSRNCSTNSKWEGLRQGLSVRNPVCHSHLSLSVFRSTWAEAKARYAIGYKKE